MKSISSDAYTFDGVGFSFELPEYLRIEKGSISKSDFGELSYSSGVMMGYPAYYDMTEEEISSLSDEDYGHLNPAGTFVIICVKDAENLEQAKERFLMAMADFSGAPLTQAEIDFFSAVKEIHRENGCMWLMARRDKMQLREECRTEYEALYNASDDIISNHMKFFTPAEWEGFDEDAVLSFEAVDLDGNTVKSEDLFAKNKVTMINIWGTHCGPCIMEMPAIEKLHQEYASKGGGVVGIVADVPADDSTFLENAQTIVKESGVTYTNIRAWEGFTELLELQGVPTTYFVDSKGKLIGAPVIGAQITVYPKEMEALLSEAE